MYTKFFRDFNSFSCTHFFIGNLKKFLSTSELQVSGQTLLLNLTNLEPIRFLIDLFLIKKLSFKQLMISLCYYM